MHSIPYDRKKAVTYARKWALSRNPAFYDFEKIGGDCTNFVSQCLYAAANIMNHTPITGWYYYSVNERSASWTGVEYLYQFLIHNQSVGPYAHIVPSHMAMPGDIVQLGTYTGHFYHSPIITEVSPIILVTAHSEDALDRPLYSYEYERARFLHVDGVRVEASEEI